MSERIKAAWKTVDGWDMVIPVVDRRPSVWGDYGEEFLRNVCRKLNGRMLAATCAMYQCGPFTVLFTAACAPGDVSDYLPKEESDGSSHKISEQP